MEKRNTLLVAPKTKRNFAGHNALDVNAGLIIFSSHLFVTYQNLSIRSLAQNRGLLHVCIYYIVLYIYVISRGERMPQSVEIQYSWANINGDNFISN